jgi:hypothetical protein
MGTHTVLRNLPRTSETRWGSTDRTRATRHALSGSAGPTEVSACVVRHYASGTHGVLTRFSMGPAGSAAVGRVLRAVAVRTCRAA